MMGLFHVFCIKSVGINKHKLSRIDSLVILYRGLNDIVLPFKWCFTGWTIVSSFFM